MVIGGVRGSLLWAKSLWPLRQWESLLYQWWTPAIIPHQIRANVTPGSVSASSGGLKLPCTFLPSTSFLCSSLLHVCLSTTWEREPCDCGSLDKGHLNSFLYVEDVFLSWWLANLYICTMFPLSSHQLVGIRLIKYHSCYGLSFSKHRDTDNSLICWFHFLWVNSQK